MYIHNARMEGRKVWRERGREGGGDKKKERKTERKQANPIKQAVF